MFVWGRTNNFLTNILHGIRVVLAVAGSESVWRQANRQEVSDEKPQAPRRYSRNCCYCLGRARGRCLRVVVRRTAEREWRHRGLSGVRFDLHAVIAGTSQSGGPGQAFEGRTTRRPPLVSSKIARCLFSDPATYGNRVARFPLAVDQETFLLRRVCLGARAAPSQTRARWGQKEAPACFVP